MGKKGLSDSGRELAKEMLGITKGIGKGICNNCDFYSKQKICSMHSIKSNPKDTCVKFKTPKSNGFKLYNGGSVSPK
ncbi:hypothetical protein RCG23_03500 [Neobacillus sp. PS3-34]|uniref:hypothetical protein n=1 Tax=Neobacillus sp. PS3-34 TaxID=3070678 RepID=UPI0027E030A4|nr:hypothetical protein [Neobacillus sp. PS3-34]WML49170.1 hypothetical protein RCG23_03500 [Neobacillus sp. PS3-34]